MLRRALALALIGLVGCAAPTALGDDPPPNPKWYVCKYVTDPKGEERLQTGQNPISVSENAFPAGVVPAVGVEFNDAQGRSVIIAEDVGQPEPSPDDCPPPNNPPTTTTSTTLPPTTTTSTTSTLPETTTTGTTAPTTTVAPTTTTSNETTTTVAPPFNFGAATTVCVREVPTIRITFQNRFPELAGETGTLTMSDVDGNVVSTQALVYEPGTTVNLLYPGTRVNPDGSIADVPGWILTNAGVWVRDPSDEFLREGIGLSYTVNPTATAFVRYPPESSECANPENPPTTTTTTTTTLPPNSPPTLPPVPTTPGIPVTR